jgi:hypothetical protein
MKRIVLRLFPTIVLAALGFPQPARSEGPDPAGAPSVLNSPAMPADAQDGEPSHGDAPSTPSGSAATALAPPDAPRPAAKPYKDPFYNNDFSYLDAPGYVSCDPFDELKRMGLAPCTVLDVGGEYRLRYHNEHNLRLNDLNNDFLLERTRLYGDLRHEWLRGYAEFIDATESFEQLVPRTSEENRADFINLFGEATLYDDTCGGVLRARVGRQEFLYGNQRVVSPSDWSNTRRTFDGAKLLWTSPTWDIDAFWTRPVPLAQHVNNDHNFDHPDQSQQFYGAYATWHKPKDQTWDFYYLGFEDNDPTTPLGNEKSPADFHTNTLGTRYQGRWCDWLWELEGAYQFGEVGDKTLSAGFCTLGGGYEFGCLPWKPVLWAYFDWASGDSDPNDGRVNTYNQLFPLGHKYFGFADLVGRQNIQDWNFQLTAQPYEKLTLLAWWHIFHLDDAHDALYNSAGAATRRSATGTAGSDVGEELDLTALYRLSMHAEILFGYSHFFAGDFISDTAAPGLSADDADFVYTQFVFRF